MYYINHAREKKPNAAAENIVIPICCVIQLCLPKFSHLRKSKEVGFEHKIANESSEKLSITWTVQVLSNTENHG